MFDQDSTHLNTFDGGLDQDLNKNVLPSNKYIECNNLSLMDLSGNKFATLENLKGTALLQELAPQLSNSNVLGIFRNRYKTTSPGVTPVLYDNFLTIFLIDNSVFKIVIFKIESSTITQIYSEAVTSDYVTQVKEIQGVVTAENGYDILYFTDFYNRPRKLICDAGLIPFSSLDLELQRRPALGTVAVSSISTGGSLLTGTYQVAYQLYEPVSNKFTSFSLLTNPIQISTTVNSIPVAGVGISSNKKFTLEITPTEDELAHYTHFRLAIVENNGPEGEVLTDVGLTKLEAISTWLGGSIITYEIKSNTQIDTTTIDDIVIDLAAIEKVRAISTAENRLLLGNIVLSNRTLNNGTPSITGGSILKQDATSGTYGSTRNSFTNDLFASRFRGHFRGEVYRYAIAYFDEYGVFSEPSVLNLTSITDNQISGATDMKFPDRSFSSGGVAYSVIGASNYTMSLGLQLVGINNHPTWAKGFVILRAKRKPNIEFQTPLVPMGDLHSIGAVGKYPTTTKEGPTAADVSYTSATPMGPDTVFIPQNFFWGSLTRGFERIVSTSGSPYAMTKGEVDGLRFTSTYTKALVYPDKTMYSATPYIFKGGEQVQLVDSALFKAYISRFDSAAYSLGESIDSSCSGSFYANTSNQYYYDASHNNLKPALSGLNVGISGNKYFENYGVGTTLNGAPTLDYSKFATGGISFGVTANNQKGVAIDLTSAIGCAASPFGSRTFAAGAPTFVPHNGVTYILNSNAYITSSSGTYGGYVNAVDIANIINNLQDTRYGATTDYNEYIFTGTKVVFTNAERATVAAAGSLPKTVDVWGGDCIVSVHTFKVSDTAYSLTNQVKVGGGVPEVPNTTGVPKWGKVWVNNNTDNAILCVPAPVKNASQYISVVLESTFNGSIRDVDTYEVVTTDNMAVLGTTTEFKCRAALTYNYSTNISKENDQKIFVNTDLLAPKVGTYRSRIYYSDIKILNTTIAGFDSVRVNNYYDLPETYGALFNLATAGDNLYAIQQDGVAYLPTGERVLELTDASQLGVRSGEIFGQPLYLSTNAGTQVAKGVISTGKEVFFLDVRRQQLFKINGQQLEPISSNGMNSFFKSALSVPTEYENTAIPAINVGLYYDFFRDHLWLALNNQNVYIWNNKYNFWESRLTFPSNGIMFAYYTGIPPSDNTLTYTNDKLVVAGYNSTDLKIQLESMYSGARTQLMGTYVTPSISFVVNPLPNLGKTFDDVLVNANNELLNLVTVVERTPLLGNQTSTTATLNVTTRGEGNYRAKILRDSGGARLRGVYATHTITWPSSVSQTQANLSAVMTKFRPSENLF